MSTMGRVSAWSPGEHARRKGEGGREGRTGGAAGGLKVVLVRVGVAVVVVGQGGGGGDGVVLRLVLAGHQSQQLLLTALG